MELERAPLCNARHLGQTRLVERHNEKFRLNIARAWIERFGGRPTLPVSLVASRSLAIGRFSFDRLETAVQAPPLPFHYLSLTLAGPLTVEACLDGANRAARIQRGVCLIMQSGRTNSWRWDHATEEAEVFLEPSFLDSVQAETGRGPLQLSHAFAFQDVALAPTILSLADELARPGGCSALFLDTAAQMIALRLLHHRPEVVRTAARSGRDGALTAKQVRRVISLVDDRIADDLCLEELADAACVSRFHFLRAFKSAIGISPHRWLVMRRIERAKDLLERSRLPVIEIAAAVGFASQSHFGAVFREHTSHSPSEWRRLRPLAGT
jgi:AraC family transcriptional regulator